MRIVDYETSRSLNDVGIFLSNEEIRELCAYLNRLSEAPSIQHVHLSELVGVRLERELTVVRDVDEQPMLHSA